MKFLVLMLLITGCSLMQNKKGELKKDGILPYMVESTFGEITVKPSHRRWEGYPFINYEERIEFLKSVALKELAPMCGDNSIKVNVAMDSLDYPPSMMMSFVNPSGLVLHYTCKLKEATTQTEN